MPLWKKIYNSTQFLMLIPNNIFILIINGNRMVKIVKYEKFLKEMSRVGLALKEIIRINIQILIKLNL